MSTCVSRGLTLPGLERHPTDLEEEAMVMEQHAEVVEPAGLRHWMGAEDGVVVVEARRWSDERQSPALRAPPLLPSSGKASGRQKWTRSGRSLSAFCSDIERKADIDHAARHPLLRSARKPGERRMTLGEPTSLSTFFSASARNGDRRPAKGDERSKRVPGPRRHRAQGGARRKQAPGQSRRPAGD